jgi:hypothetical protein
LNSAASVTYSLPFKRQQKKKNERGPVLLLVLGGGGILQRKGPIYSSFMRPSQMEV